MSPIFSSGTLSVYVRVCLCLVLGGILTSLRTRAQAVEAIAVTPKTVAPGQTVTLKWYFTGTKVVVAGGRFGKGTEVTGRTSLTDTPQKTTRYTFDVWYPDGKSAANPKPLLHAQYTATAEVGQSAKEPPEEQLAYQVLELVNKERAVNGLPPLHLHPVLQAAAHWLAQDMATNDYLDHTDHEGRELEGRLTAFEYKDYMAAGENIAAGQATAAEVVANWLQSPGHRSNILSPDFTEIGIGHQANAGSKFRHYWAQDFGKVADVYPVVINSGANRTSQLEVKLYIYGAAATKQMRLSNDGVTWTDWETYQPQRDWTLAPGSGKHSVYVELKDAKQTYRSVESIEVFPARAPAASPGVAPK